MKPARCQVVRDGTVCGGEIGPVIGGSSSDPYALGCYRCLSHWPEMRWCVPEEKREPLSLEDYERVAR